jgi:hypothetical protein
VSCLGHMPTALWSCVIGTSLRGNPHLTLFWYHYYNMCDDCGCYVHELTYLT